VNLCRIIACNFIPRLTLWHTVAGLILVLALSLLAFTVTLSAQNAVSNEAIKLQHEGKLQEAAQVWQSVVSQNPKNAEAFASLGTVFSKLKNFNQAAEAYRKALALDPKLPNVSLNLGVAEFKQAHFQAAVEPLKLALQADPASTQARVLLALSCYAAGRYAEVVAYLSPAVEADPSNTELRQTLAQSSLWAGQYQRTLTEAQELLRQNPHSAPTRMLMGEALDAMDKDDEAIDEFQAAAKESPKEPNVHFALGYLYWKQKEYDDAEREFRAELANDPEHSQSCAYLGDTLLRENNPSAAAPLLKKASQLRNDIRIAYLDLGIIYTEQKKYDEALKHLKHAEQIDPSRPDAHYRLARLYQDLGRQSEASQEFAKVSKLHEDNTDDLLGKIAGSPARASN
jgi:tetratricopeptide (TPR) repeat protein